MHRHRRPAISKPGPGALIAVLAVAAIGCGGDDPAGSIPEEPAQALLAQLGQIEASVAAGDCDAAQTEALSFAQAVNDLPAEVDPPVRENLVEAAGNLETLTGNQCEPAQTGATGAAEAVPPPETEPTTTPDEEPADSEPSPAGDDRNPQPTPADDKPSGGSGAGTGSGGSSSGGVGNG